MSAFSQAADEVCMQICEEFAEEGSELMEGMCANEGQSAIIAECIPVYVDLCLACYQGDNPGGFNSSHDEAVGEIVDVGNALIDACAAICEAIQTAAEALDLNNELDSGF